MNTLWKSQLMKKIIAHVQMTIGQYVIPNFRFCKSYNFASMPNTKYWLCSSKPSNGPFQVVIQLYPALVDPPPNSYRICGVLHC